MSLHKWRMSMLFLPSTRITFNLLLRNLSTANFWRLAHCTTWEEESIVKKKSAIEKAAQHIKAFASTWNERGWIWSQQDLDRRTVYLESFNGEAFFIVRLLSLNKYQSHCIWSTWERQLTAWEACFWGEMGLNIGKYFMSRLLRAGRSALLSTRVKHKPVIRVVLVHTWNLTI